MLLISTLGFVSLPQNTISSMSAGILLLGRIIDASLLILINTFPLKVDQSTFSHSISV